MLRTRALIASQIRLTVDLDTLAPAPTASSRAASMSGVESPRTHPAMISVGPPVFGEDLGFEKRVELGAVQKLLAEAAVEARWRLGRELARW
jgi:hypothetical protein